ncbi:MAG TPA: TMEM175 family protein [Bacteroidia bacterium]|nr:TMEM175 family protein [Bacteroidia bacterium]
MTKTRLEAFSDGVIAIIITIMVLELKIPHEATFAALSKLAPVFLSYLISFIFVAIYWGNHHHLLHTVHHVTSGIMWANMGLLFCLSLIPFSTGWMGENHFDNVPVAIYGVSLLLCAVSYYFLQMCIMKHYTHTTKLIIALQKQRKKGIVSLVGYIVSISCAFFLPIVSACVIVGIAIWWVIPDKNIEEALKDQRQTA